MAELIDGLGPWADGNGPLFRKLARALAAGIERGAFAPDARLPSERALAGALSIGRGTAVAAYDVLVADGLLERRQGSGTFVAVDRPHLPYGREGSALVHRLVERSERAGGVIDLSLSVLRDADGVPSVSVRTTDLAGVVPDTGYTPWGLAPLRALIASMVSEWGLPTSEHEVVVTTGAQQAISLAAVCWLRPGDVVVVDDPTYPGALAAFRQAGATVVGVPVDERGVRADALSAALRRRPAAVYLQSTLNSPTGVVTSLARRREVARVLDEARVPLIEDMALAGLAWQSSPPPIASLVRTTSAAVIGSLGKLFWGGLRVGFVRAPAPLALRFARIKATHDLGSSAVTQLLAARMLASPAASAFGPQRVAESGRATRCSPRCCAGTSRHGRSERRQAGCRCG